MTRIKLFSNSILIATDPNNSDVQLRQIKDEFWMTSPKTGEHMIIDTHLSKRVEAHWEGFKQNQNN